MQKQGIAVLAIVLGILVLSGAMVYAAFSLTVSGSVTVTTTAPATQAQLLNVSVNGTTCTIASGGLTASCPGINLAVGSTANLSVTVNNIGTTADSPTVNPTSTTASVASISANSGNPTSVAGGSTGVYQFTITGVGAGITNYSVALSG